MQAKAVKPVVFDIVSLALKLFWRRLGLLLSANIVWLALSLLVMPWPAATAGLFYLVRRIVAEELEAAPRYARLSDFWEGFRRFGLRSSALTVVDLLVLVALFTAWRFYAESTIEPLRWLLGPIGILGLAWAGAQLYLYPLLIQRGGRTIRQIAAEAGLIAISYPVNTLSLLVLVLILAIVAVILAGPILLVFFSFLAMLQTILLRSVLVQRGEVAALVKPEELEARQAGLGHARERRSRE